MSVQAGNENKWQPVCAGKKEKNEKIKRQEKELNLKKKFSSMFYDLQ